MTHERPGVPVYIGWADDDSEWELDRVPVAELGELPGKVFGLFEGSETPVSDVNGYLVYDPAANQPVIYRINLEASA